MFFILHLIYIILNISLHKYHLNDMEWFIYINIQSYHHLIPFQYYIIIYIIFHLFNGQIILLNHNYFLLYNIYQHPIHLEYITYHFNIFYYKHIHFHLINKLLDTFQHIYFHHLHLAYNINLLSMLYYKFHLHYYNPMDIN